jgi:two-component system chemotaxis response regulator CheB
MVDTSTGHDIIVIGASAGGVEALTTIVSGLPADLPAAVFVVLHISPNSTSVLPQLITRAGALPATHARSGEPIRRGCIYVAPPDQHMLLADGHILLSRGPRENLSRPSVDPLFRSAAQVYGARVVGVILTGALDDGTSGLLAVKRAGGIAIVQDPNEALFPSMPSSAMRYVAVDASLPLGEIAPALTQYVSEAVAADGGSNMSDRAEDAAETDQIVEMDVEEMTHDERTGQLAPYACPECGGTLWEIRDDKLIRFRCRIGHAFSVESLLAAQTEQLEGALWAALRALEEKASLSGRLADRAENQGHMTVVHHFREQASTSTGAADVIRDVLMADSDDTHNQPLRAQSAIA